MLDKETGIPCFECGRRSGIDCPGRKSDEATRCKECFDAFMEKARMEQVEHLAKYIGYLRRENKPCGQPSVRMPMLTARMFVDY